MKKKIGLVALLLSGASAIALSGCNSAEVQGNKDDIAKLNRTVTALETRISTVDETLKKAIADEIAKVNASMAAVDEASQKAIDEAIGSLQAEIEMADVQVKEDLLKSISSTKDALEAELNTEKEELDKKISDLDDSVKETLKSYATVEALEAKLNTAKEELAAEIGTSVDELDEKISALDNSVKETLKSYATVEALQTELNTAKEELASEIGTSVDELDKKISDLDDSVKETLKSYATVEALNAAIARIEALEATVADLNAGTVTDSELENAVQTLSGIDEDLQDQIDSLKDSSDDYSTRIQALETAKGTIDNSITKINGTLTAYNTRITSLETLVGTLQNNGTNYEKSIEDLKKADEDFTTTIANLTTLSATKQELTNNIAALNLVDQNLQAAIDDAKAELQEKDKDLDSKISNILTTLDNHEQAIKDLLTAIGESSQGVTNLLEDFYGEDTKQAKGAYVYELSQVYADYQEQLAEVKEELIKTYTVDGVIKDEDSKFINELYNRLYATSNHEMQGHLYKGIEFITLAATEEDAKAAYTEYEEKLESFINEARFEISKEILRQQVAKYSYMPADTQTAILKQIEDIKYVTADTYEMSASEIDDYYNMRVNTITIYATRAANIESAYSQKKTVKDLISALTNITPQEKDRLIGLADDSVSIESFMELGEALEMDESILVKETYEAALTSIGKLFADDKAELILLGQQALGYDYARAYNATALTSIEELQKLATQSENLLTVVETINEVPVLDDYLDCAKAEDVTSLYNDNKAQMDIYVYEATKYDALLDHNNTNYNYLNTLLVSITSDEKTSILKKVTSVVVFDAYFNDTFETTKAIDEKLAEDKAYVDLLVAQASAYEAARSYDIGYEEYVADLTSITSDEKKTINGLIKGTVSYDMYIEAIDTIDEVQTKLSSDKKAIGLIYEQAKAYDIARGYDISNEATITALQTITSDEKTAINKLINETVLYNNYINENLDTKTKIDEQVDADIKAIDLIVAQATAYNDVRNYEASKEAIVSEFENITADEVKSINEAINALVSYNSFVGALESKDIQASVEATNAAVDLLLAQAIAYNHARGFDINIEQNITENLTHIPSTEIKNINNLIGAVSVYADYISNVNLKNQDDINKKHDADADAMILLYHQAQGYDSVILAMENKVNNLETLEMLTTDEVTAATKLFEAIPVYANYINALADEDAILNKTQTDISALDLISYQVTMYNHDRNYDVTTEGAINNLTSITSDEKASINELIKAIPVFADYIALTKTTDVDAMSTTNCEAISLLEHQANAYNATKSVASSKVTYVQGLTNITSDEKTTICGLISAVPVYNEYIEALANTTAISDKSTSDAQAISLILYKIDNYKASRDYELYYETALDDENVKFSKDDITSMKGYLNAIPVFNSYVNATTETAIDNLLAAEKQSVDIIVHEIQDFESIINYVDDAVAANATYAERAERTTVNGLMKAIPLWNNYKEKSITDSATQLASDKATVDLLKTRITTFYQIVDYVASSNGYIDDINPTNGTFDSNDKAKFKALFAAYATEEVFDAAIADFTTAKAYSDYYAQAKVAIDLLAKTSPQTFANIINLVALETAKINANVSLSAELKKAFIDNIRGYAVYDNYILATSGFDEELDFTNYQATVKSAIDSIDKIVNYELQILAYANTKKTQIETARATNGDITSAEATYLNKVIDAIYQETTNKNVTSVTDAADNYNKAKSEMDGATNAIHTFNVVDDAINKLDKSLDEYVHNAEVYIHDSYYEDVYKNAELAWNEYVDDILAKKAETQYSYTLPEAFDYTTFNTFITSLPQPTTITNRISLLATWYENEEDADEDGMEDGMLYKITYKFYELEAETLTEAKPLYIDKLETAYQSYIAFNGTDATKPNYSSVANKIKLANNTYKNIINNATSSKAVIEGYENGVKAMDQLVIQIAKDFYLAEFDSLYDELINENPDFQKELTDAHDEWQGIIYNASTSQDVAAQYELAYEAINAVVDEI